MSALDATTAPASAVADSWRHSARSITTLAWPVFVGQISVLAFGTIDTLLVARAGATDLAALAVGAAAYITVFVGFMGVLMALSPIVGQLYGAGRLHDAGRQAQQAVWLALGMAVLGSSLLAFPYPFLALSQVSPEVAEKVRGYLLALAFSLPASLLFTVYRGFNTAVSRPRAVMVIQVGGLLVKLPLSWALVFGVPSLNVPALGVLGCGIATGVAMWAQALTAALVVRHDPFYRRFGLLLQRLPRPDRASIVALLKLGVPMGASILVEVTGFVFMAIFIARLGTTPVAGHQIAANLVSMLFMLPLAVANACTTLVAQRVGAGAPQAAARLAWHGLLLGTALATVVGSVVLALRPAVLRLYTHDAAVLAAAMPLVAWLVVFHIADAAQTIAAFVLRAYKIVAVPMAIYVVALWCVGLGGGYLLAFDVPGGVPPSMQGARGFWVASTTGLVVAALALTGYLLLTLRRQQRLPAA